MTGPEKLCFKRVSCPFLSMDPAQFKEYTDGMAVLETTRTLRRHHEQCKQALLHQTTLCDGTSPAGVRAWFKDIELAGAEVGAENQIEIAARTAACSLRWELERYIAGVLATNDQINIRFNVPWADVKAHLRTSFQNVDESSALRDELENTQQSAYEPEASFSLRARKKAGRRGQPYRAGRGLHHPGWLQCQEGQHEEPMEVAPVNPAPSHPVVARDDQTTAPY